MQQTNLSDLPRLNVHESVAIMYNYRTIVRWTWWLTVTRILLPAFCVEDPGRKLVDFDVPSLHEKLDRPISDVDTGSQLSCILAWYVSIA